MAMLLVPALFTTPLSLKTKQYKFSLRNWVVFYRFGRGVVVEILLVSALLTTPPLSKTKQYTDVARHGHEGERGIWLGKTRVDDFSSNPTPLHSPVSPFPAHLRPDEARSKLLTSDLMRLEANPFLGPEIGTVGTDLPPCWSEERFHDAKTSLLKPVVEVSQTT